MQVPGLGDIAASTVIACLIVLAGSIAAWRRFRLPWRADTGARITAAKLAWLALQCLACISLWLALFPLARQIDGATLRVLTARSGEAASFEDSGHTLTVQLPEARGVESAAYAADLATALRGNPQVTRLHVVGAGLLARDRDAASALHVRFSAAPASEGLVQLHAPVATVAGNRWSVHGRVHGVKGGHVELRDPSGARVARHAIGSDGAFVVSAVARAPGSLLYRLRVLRPGGAAVHPDVSVPVVASTGDRVRLLLLAGAPDAELKYLRRWAMDAGLDARTEIATGAVGRLVTPGRRGDWRFSDFDAVVLDQRTWRGFDTARMQELMAFVRGGGGVLLRADSAPAESDRTRLAAMGFGAALYPPPQLQANRVANAWRSAAPDATDLEGTKPGEPGGLVRVEGSGRIAIWWARDTYRIVLAGDAGAHARLWSVALGGISRARTPESLPEWQSPQHWIGQRSVVCGGLEGARVATPSGKTVALVPVGTTRRGQDESAGCAGFWPRESGWHILEIDGRSAHFHVRGLADGSTLRAAGDAGQTRRLAERARPGRTSSSFDSERPGARWPWFMLWLGSSAALWALERRTAGMALR